MQLSFVAGRWRRQADQGVATVQSAEPFSCIAMPINRLYSRVYGVFFLDLLLGAGTEETTGTDKQ